MRERGRETVVMSAVVGLLALVGAVYATVAARQWADLLAYRNARPCAARAASDAGPCVRTVRGIAVLSLPYGDAGPSVYNVYYVVEGPRGPVSHRAVIAWPADFLISDGTDIEVEEWNGRARRIRYAGFRSARTDADTGITAPRATARAVGWLAGAAAVLALWRRWRRAAAVLVPVVAGAVVTAYVADELRYPDGTRALATFLVTAAGAGVLLALRRTAAGASRPTPWPAPPAAR